MDGDTDLRISLGAGHVREAGWKRLDIDPECEPDILDDVRKMQQIPEKSVAELKAFHVLEHIFESEAFLTMRLWWKKLRPGGKLTVEVPDCGWAMRAWTAGEVQDIILVRTILGGDPEATPWMLHKNIFWPGRLVRLFTITGYERVSVEDTGRPDRLQVVGYRPVENGHHGG